MTTALNKTDDGTMELTVTLPWIEVSQAYQKTVNELIKLVEIKGFRKGKAPRDLAEKKLPKNKIYQEVIKEIVPKAYADALKEHNINSFIQPEIKLIKAKENEDWQFLARTCEKPKVSLGNYQQIVKRAKNQAKKTSIWVPGKEKEQKEKSKEQNKQEELNNILETLIKEVKLTIPNILIENELNRRLSNLLDEVKKIGLTIDKYLQAKRKTLEQLKKEYENEIRKTYQLEFILEEITDQEKITVSDEDINKMIAQVKEEKERKALETQRYYLASLLRRQKTLDKLLAL